MSEYTRREMEYRAEQIAHEARKRLGRMEHIVNGLGEVRGEIVRCRDCKHYREHEWVIATDISDVCMFFADGVKVAPDGFCAWGERREAWTTCKCGEKIELGGREYAVCPSCGRMVRE